MATLSESVSAPTVRARSLAAPISEPLLAWFVVATSVWFIGGVYLDGWAHNHGRVDDSFFTPWHAVLYSGYGATAAVLLAALFRNRAAGLSWRRALPDGYGISLVGVLIFGVAGLLDMVWHTLFGVEIGADALLSPTHLSLALGGSLMSAGPLRHAWRQVHLAPSASAWLPVLLSLTVVLSFITFMSQFANPFVWPQAGNSEAIEHRGSSVYSMNADGSGQRRLTYTADQLASQAAWAPNGRGLAMIISDPKRETTVLSVTNDGTASTAVVAASGKQAPQLPVWSPDGQRIAFILLRAGAPPELFVLDRDSGTQRQVTNDGVAVSRPAWSPDGQRILYVADRDGSTHLRTVTADGTRDVAVPNGHSAGTGSWSPDGARIAFGSDRDGTWHVYSMDLDGSDLRQLTSQTRRPDGQVARSWWPAWSPDGTQIAFQSDRSGTLDVFVMRGDGSLPTNLTDNPSLNNTHPAWSPDGRQLTFTGAGHTEDADLHIAYGVASVLVQAALLAGMVLVIARRWRVPFGTFTLVFTLNAVLVSFQNDQYALIAAAAVGGLLTDVLLRRLRPFDSERRRDLQIFAFAVPALLYAAFFAALAVDQGLAWSVHAWTGSVMLAGVVGWLLSQLVAVGRGNVAQRPSL